MQRRRAVTVSTSHHGAAGGGANKREEIAPGHRRVGRGAGVGYPSLGHKFLAALFVFDQRLTHKTRPLIQPAQRRGLAEIPEAEKSTAMEPASEL